MTGRQIRRLREELGLDPFALAGVLGVHVSTIYRWEAHAGNVRMDPLQAQIMEALRARVAAQPQAANQLNQAIVNGLIAGGALVALLALLRNLLDEEC
jgi:transcriptional regulator with XRE-family HTH domain